MKNRINILILISIIFVCSCQQTKETAEGKFKASIGVENFERLNHFMEKMEQKIMINYGVTNINDAYNSYLTNKFLGRPHLELGASDCQLYHSIIKTEITSDWIKLKYDKVFEQDDLIVTISDNDTSWLVKPPEKYKGEYKDKIEEEGYYKQMKPNPLYRALEYANTGNNLLSNIISANNYEGLIDMESIMNAIALEDVNFEEEYLYRIIICFEIYLNELKEYGC